MRIQRATCLLFLCAAPMFVAQTVQIPGVAGPIELKNLLWEGANPAGKCMTTNEASLLVTGTAAVQAQVTQMCATHAQVPQLAVELVGEKHLLQQVTFVSCKSNNWDNPPTTSFRVRFKYCSLHIAPAIAQVTAEGVPSGNVKLVMLRFVGKSGTVALQHDNWAGPASSFFSAAYASKKTYPSLMIKVNAQTWTFTNVLVSGYQQSSDKETYSFTFAGVNGPAGGYEHP